MADVIDAAVVVVALRYGAAILSDDPRDIARLVWASGSDIAIVSV